MTVIVWKINLLAKMNISFDCSERLLTFYVKKVLFMSNFARHCDIVKMLARYQYQSLVRTSSAKKEFPIIQFQLSLMKRSRFMEKKHLKALQTLKLLCCNFQLYILQDWLSSTYENSCNDWLKCCKLVQLCTPIIIKMHGRPCRALLQMELQ